MQPSFKAGEEVEKHPFRGRKSAKAQAHSIRGKEMAVTRENTSI